ncbi:MAG TPA: ABC transporter substrate-binding protein [Bradyrhizobium sp.]|uniref:ABC transporter substrate-binding protein n=1 Tax=Bradyrhizobium sp. TaxID=376 RepID=UPI002BAF8945|nr:ABC transporter substrate-binding protein [Bradyrhizobium sp.]HLZ06090.1 ABC transporter substrate-binding protein [Bradyrhizobium sp.]
MDKIKIAMAHRGAGVAPVFAALEGGYLRENGLEPELVFYHGHPNSLKAVIAGEAQFTNAVGAELLLANHRHGGDAVVLASAISRSAQQVAALPGIKTREDLRGKRWGVTFRNDADECAMIMAFDRWGWSIEKDVEIVVVGNAGARLDLLLDPGKVDVAIMHAPETFQAPKRGYHIAEDFGRLDVSFQNSCAASTRSFVKSHPDIGLRYVKSFCQGVHRFRSDADFGIHVLRKYSGETDIDVLRPTWVLFARYMGDMMFPSLEGVRNASAILHRVGALPRQVAPEEAVDLEPVATLEAQGFFEMLMEARHVAGQSAA